MADKYIEEIFRQKYEKYSQLIFKIAFLHMGSTCDAEDVMQNVFMKLLYNSPDFKDDEHEKAWLIRVTQNMCQNSLKVRVRQCAEYNDGVAADKERDISKAIDISMKIKDLPASYKTAIFLCYYEDMTIKDISKTLRISQSAVKMRLKRGRKLLRSELEEYRYE